MSQPSQHQSGHAAEALLFSDKELIRMAVPFILSFALSQLPFFLAVIFPFLLTVATSGLEDSNDSLR